MAEPFFWLCLVERNKWAWLNPQVRKGAKPSTSVLALSSARSSQPPVSWGSVQGFGSSSSPLELTGICFPASHTSGDHWNLCRCLGSNPPLCSSQGSVFASQASLCRSLGSVFPEVTELCFFQPNLPSGGPWDLFSSQTSLLGGLYAATRLKRW